MRRTYKGGSYQDILSYLIPIIDNKARARDKIKIINVILQAYEKQS